MITRRGALLAAAAAPVVLHAGRAKARPASLDRNENPYGPSPAAMRAMQRAIAHGNRYADREELDALKERIAAREGITREHVVLGAGSSEILALIAAAFLRDGASLVMPEVTFPLIGRCAEACGARIERKPDLEAMRDVPSRVTYFCNPNNPTGTYVEATAFTDDVSRRALVVADEAYIEYLDAPRSMVPFVRNSRDVIVVRTFSKIYGLAGVRIGYALARPELAAKMSAHSFSMVSNIAVAAAMASLEDGDFAKQSRAKNAATRDALCRGLREREIEYLPSHANFVWFRCGQRAKRIAASGVRISPWPGEWARVTIGTDEEVAQFLKAL